MGLDLMALADSFDCSMRSVDSGFDYLTHSAEEPFDSLFDHYVSTDHLDLGDSLGELDEVCGGGAAAPSAFELWSTSTSSGDDMAAGASSPTGLQLSSHLDLQHSPELRRSTPLINGSEKPITPRLPKSGLGASVDGKQLEQTQSSISNGSGLGIGQSRLPNQLTTVYNSSSPPTPPPSSQQRRNKRSRLPPSRHIKNSIVPVTTAHRNTVISGRVRRNQISPTTKSAVKMMAGSQYSDHRFSRRHLDLSNGRYNLGMSHHALPNSPPPSAKSSIGDEMRASCVPPNYGMAGTAQRNGFTFPTDISPRESFSGQLSSSFTPGASPNVTMHDPASQLNSIASDPLSSDTPYYPPTTPYQANRLSSPTTCPPSQDVMQPWSTLKSEPELTFDFSATGYPEQADDSQVWWTEQSQTLEPPPTESHDFHYASAHERAQEASKSLMHMTGTEFDQHHHLAAQSLDYLSASHQAHDPFNASATLPSPPLATPTGLLSASSSKRSSRGPGGLGVRSPSPINKVSPRSKSAKHHQRHRSTPHPLPRNATKIPLTASSSSVPHTPTSSSGMGGFVNYTPNDSMKILHGVAPSGSSKTKARREKEAAEKKAKWEKEQKDKRRRLSTALKGIVKGDGADMDEISRLVEQEVDV